MRSGSACTSPMAAALGQMCPRLNGSSSSPQMLAMELPSISTARPHTASQSMHVWNPGMGEVYTPPRGSSVERRLPGVPQDVEAARDAVVRIDEPLVVDDGVIHLDGPHRVLRRRLRDIEADLFEARRRAGERGVDQAVDPNASVEEARDRRVLETNRS